MATKKAASKKGAGAKKAAGATAKRAAQPLYGIAIREAIAGGDAAEMRRVRAAAVKHVGDVESALAKLDAKLKKG
jgi:hypothetical protein